MICRNYAHRGFSGKYPENTMLAFRKALEAGCEGIELDVQMTKDGELVIIHDETINRTSNKKGKVKDFTYKKLCKIDFSYKYSKKFGFQKIPTLREYFELVQKWDIISNIELKTSVYEYEGIEQAVYDLICEFDLKDKVIISSFNHYSVLKMKVLDPGIKCGLLTETWMFHMGDYMKESGMESFHPHFAMLTDDILEDLRKHNISINTWTVNEKEDIKQMIHIGVDGIIGNYPDRVRKLLKKSGLR